MIKLDIVLPCYNPLADWSERVVTAFKDIEKALPNVALYLYVVNDGSLKNVEGKHIEFLKQAIPNFRFVTYETNQGKGYALRKGIAETQNNWCIYTDIDFPYTEASFLAIYKALTKNQADIVVGKRETSYYKNVPLLRIWISKSLKWFIKNLLRLPITDTQCGLKGFNKKGKAIFLKTEINRYLFDLEFVFLAARVKTITLKPVIVQLKPGIVFSTMSFKILSQEGWSFLKIFVKSWF